MKEAMMDEILKAVKAGKVKSIHVEMEGAEDEHEMGVDEEEKSSGMVCPECGCKMEPKEMECPECGYETDAEEAPEEEPKKEREMSPAHKREMDRHEARTKVKDEGEEDSHPPEERLKNIEKLKEYARKK